MILTPCAVSQVNVAVYQGQISKTHGTKFNIPVVYYSTRIPVAVGRGSKGTALDGQMIRATRLYSLANK